MKYYLGLDVGGTNLAAGIVDENYHLLHKESIPAGAGRSVEDIIEDMAKVSKSVIKHLGLPISKISSWGIGMPSYINPKTGLLVHAICFGWKNIDIYSYLQSRYLCRFILKMMQTVQHWGKCWREQEKVIGMY